MVDSTDRQVARQKLFFFSGGRVDKTPLLLNTMDLDDVWLYLGDFGRYQTLAYILITLVGTWLPAWQIFGVIFTADSPPFHCQATPGFTLEESVPRQEVPMNQSFAGCKMYDVVKAENGTSFINTSTKVDCTNGYEFISPFGENTIVMEVRVALFP